MSDHRCLFHDAEWRDGESWCSVVVDNWHDDLSLDLTDCVPSWLEAE